MKKPIKAASLAMRQLFSLIDESSLTARQIARPAGVHPITLSYWKHDGRSPRLTDFENVAEVLGYRLKLEPIGEKSDG